MLVVGGPSGAGKSYRFPVEQSGYPFFNVDDWIRDNLNEGGPPDKPAVLVLVAGAGAARSVDPVVPGWLRAALAGTEYAKALR